MPKLVIRSHRDHFNLLSALLKTSLLLSFFFFYQLALSQNEASNWYFGYGAGLDFSKGEPVFQKGSINQWEGCASASDRKGRLLFYTNGGFVWNKNHKVMPNGKGLKGHNSSTQSSIIVPDPGSNNLYYLFTVTASAESDGLQYSIVDMEANDGLGDIVKKNIPLATPVCEKITAVRHANKKDVWVITHKYNSDEYYAYLVKANSIDTQPVISKTGNIISGGLNTIGYLKSSANGTKLAAAHMTTFTEVSDFDQSTGLISNTIKLAHDPRSYAYGVEFSKNAEFLYVTEMSHVNGTGRYAIFQYRVNGNADTMLASKYTVATGDVGGAAGALQIGPDNRMYVAMNKKNYLGCILYPDKQGSACQFELEHVSLSKARSGLGLPTFLQSYFMNAGPSGGYLYYSLGFLLLLLLILLFIWRKRKKKQKEELNNQP